MTKEEAAANERIAYMQKRQELLASAVSELEASLYEAILGNLDKIMQDPAALEKAFNSFTAEKHTKVLKQFAGDILSIGKNNAAYFEALDINAKDYGSIKKDVDKYLLERFGLTGTGQAVKGGFIDTFATDPSLKRALKDFGYKTQATGGGLKEFTDGFRNLIRGSDNAGGLISKYYRTFAYDTYQQADSAVQEQYAKKLELTACLYLGGKIAGTRPFCNERNGKVFLRDEIEAWKKLEFAGKPANYNPFIDRGGYNCRHMLNYISDKMAIRRRPDLYIDENGRLTAGNKPSVKEKPETVSKQAESGKFQETAKKALPDKTVFSKESVAEYYPAKINPAFWKNFDDSMNIKMNITTRKNGAFYSPLNNEININIKEKRFKDSPYGMESVLIHEGAHAMHYSRNILKHNGIAKDLKEVVRDSYEWMDSKDLGGEVHVEIKNLFTSIFQKKPINERSAELLNETFKGIKPEDLIEMLSQTFDTLGALTNGYYGGGHSKKYYSLPKYSEMEFFAHAAENYYIEGGNPALKYFLPGVEKRMNAYMKIVEERKNETIK